MTCKIYSCTNCKMTIKIKLLFKIKWLLEYQLGIIKGIFLKKKKIVCKFIFNTNIYVI